MNKKETKKDLEEDKLSADVVEIPPMENDDEEIEHSEIPVVKPRQIPKIGILGLLSLSLYLLFLSWIIFVSNISEPQGIKILILSMGFLFLLDMLHSFKFFLK